MAEPLADGPPGIAEAAREARQAPDEVTASEQPPLALLSEAAGRLITTEELYAILCRAIATTLETTPDSFDLDAQFMDLGLDSLALTEVMVEVEEELQMDFPMELLERFDEALEVETLGDLLQIISG